MSVADFLGGGFKSGMESDDDDDDSQGGDDDQDEEDEAEEEAEELKEIEEMDDGEFGGSFFEIWKKGREEEPIAFQLEHLY